MARMKRNANGSGSIYKREDGRWEGKYSIPAADGRTVPGEADAELFQNWLVVNVEVHQKIRLW